MCYSRAVIFNGGEFDKSEVRFSVFNTMSSLNSEDFRCPISLELMTDPATVSTGQTYDRASIHKWLKSGNLTCPKTGEKLKTSELVSNLALKKLIQQFCVDNGFSLTKSGKENRDVSKTILPGSVAAGEIVRFIAEFLAGRLTYGTDDQKNKATFEILLSLWMVAWQSLMVASHRLLQILLTSIDLEAMEQAFVGGIILIEDGSLLNKFVLAS